jgi:hypothetical protein
MSVMSTVKYLGLMFREIKLYLNIDIYKDNSHNFSLFYILCLI